MIRSYDAEVSITDAEAIAAFSQACLALGECEDGGYSHAELEIVFANSENEICIYPAVERCDYMQTSGGTFYRTGMDRRDQLCELLKEYGFYLA